MKKITLFLITVLTAQLGFGQALNFLNGSFNLKSSISQRIGLTTVEVSRQHWWSRAAKALFGVRPSHITAFKIRFGTSTLHPGSAGANECTTISFSTDVEIEGKKLAAGTYGFFIALGEEQSTGYFFYRLRSLGAVIFTTNVRMHCA
ncbi:MAG: DUF2911 domain-containing protein [Saprospiraceae bacterium]